MAATAMHDDGALLPGPTSADDTAKGRDVGSSPAVAESAPAAAEVLPSVSPVGGHSPMRPPGGNDEGTTYGEQPQMQRPPVLSHHHERVDSVLQSVADVSTPDNGPAPAPPTQPPELATSPPAPPSVVTSTTTTAETGGVSSGAVTGTGAAENGGREGRDKREKREKKEKRDKGDSGSPHDRAGDVDPSKREKKEKKKDKSAKGDSPTKVDDEPTRGGLSKHHRKAGMRGNTGGVNGGISPPKPEGGGDTPDQVSRDVFHLDGVPTAAVNLGDNRLVVHVHNMGPLSANPDIVHPFIRLWIIDAATGESLALSPNGDAVPAFTHPFDLRDHESVSPQWEEQVMLELNEPLRDAVAPVVMFELLDFGDVNIRGENKVRGGADLMPIAWGFLNLTDAYGRSNLRRRLHVQLFRSPERRSYFRSLMITARAIVNPTVQSQCHFGGMTHGTDMKKVPPIFRNTMNFLDRNDVYDACLTVNVFLKDDTYDLPDPPLLTTRDQENMEELFVTLSRVQAGGLVALPGRSMGSIGGSYDGEGRSKLPARALALEAERKARLDLLNKDTSRLRNERCLPPKAVLHTIHAHAKVSALAFSPDSQLLAVGLMADFIATIRIYHLPSPKADMVGELHGHVGHIHELAFSRDGRLLVSSSADHTARVWDVSSPPVIDIAPAHVFAHTSHVYSAQVLNAAVITAGFDGVLSLWSLDTGMLVFAVSNSFHACFRSIHLGPLSYSNHKIWTLDSIGFFSTWRAIVDPATGKYTSLEPRRRLQIVGAIRAHVEGNVALLYVPSDNPTFHVLDTVSYAVLQVVSCGHLPSHLRGAAPRLATALLPDSHMAVLALSSSSVLGFDLTVGELFTNKSGFTVAPGQRIASQIVWAPNKHMCAMALSQPDGPAGCEIAIAVRPRVAGEECRERDAQVLTFLRHLYGGEITLRPSNTAPGSTTSTANFAMSTSMRQSKAGLSTGSFGHVPSASTAPGSSRHRRPGIDIGPEHGPLSNDTQTRFNQIIAWWKGRVASHATTGATTQASPGTAVQIETPMVPMLQPPATVVEL